MKSEAQLKAEIERLQRSVEEQALEVDSKNRELEIEAALERVRERAMSMQKSEELRELVFEFYKQIHPFGFAKWGFEIKIAQEDKSGFYCWISPPGARIQPEGFEIPTLDHWVLKKYWSTFELQTPSVTIEVSGDDKRKLGVLLLGQSDMKNLPEDVKTNITETEYVHFSVAAMRFGLLKAVDMVPVLEKDSFILQRFAKVFEQTYTRFLDLQKAEAQAREAQIEVALERVRARAMAMHKSEELGEAAELLYEELRKLGLSDFINCGYVEIDEENNCQYGWMTNSKGKSMEKFNLPLVGEPTLQMRFDAWLRKESVFCQTVGGDELKKHLAFVSPQLGSKEVLEHVKNFFHDPTIFYSGNFSHGYLSYITKSRLSADEEALLARFTQVFEMTYKRFLDLQKAEAQAREAQIEAALEKVRARAMGLRESNELKEVIAVIYKELSKLGLAIHDANIVIEDPKSRALTFWGSGLGGFEMPPKLTIPFINHKTFRKLYYDWDRSVDFYTFFLKGKEFKEYWQILIEETEVGNAPEAFIEAAVSVGQIHLSQTAIKNGFLEVASDEALTIENIEILLRFGSVVDITYTRFYDILKAEAQAREAEIQLALERVRARTMAMQKSDELSEVASIMFQKIQELGTQQWTSGFEIWLPDQISSTAWVSKPDGSIAEPMTIPFNEDPYFKTILEARQSGQPFLVFESSGKSLENTYKYMSTFSSPKKFFDESENLGFQIPTFQITHCVFFSFGFLIFITYEPVPEMWDIFKRFTKVFEQTYTRFLDLQKAEAQAREAQVEVALERIRSRSMAMRSSEELREVVQEMYNQVEKLGISNWGCFLLIFDKEKQHVQGWFSEIVNSKYADPFYFDNKDHEVIRKWWKFWESDEEFMSIHQKDEVKYEFVTYLFTKTGMKDLPEEVKTMIINEPQVYFQYVNMEHGLIQYIDIKPFPVNSITVLKRITDVFEQAYTRFLDLQKAEAQAREAQIEVALERIRAKAMAMRSSNELMEVANTLREQMRLLDQPGLESSMVLLYDEEKFTEEDWFAFLPPKGSDKKILTGSITWRLDENEVVKKLFELYKSGVSESTFNVKGEELEELFEDIKEKFPVYIEYFDGELPENVIHFVTRFSGGHLLLTSQEEPNENSKDLQRRVTSTFDLAYNRFLDLQKAESLAREAEIELALERVRSRTMAMHKSEELSEVAALLFDQLKILGAQLWTAGFAICKKEEVLVEKWMSSPIPGQMFNHLFVPYNADHGEQRMYDTWKNQEALHSYAQGGKELKDIYDHLMEIPSFKANFQKVIDFGRPLPVWQKNHVAAYKYGYLLIITEEEFEEEYIFPRFAKVFEQTYTRFLDLEKAEAQAREAQIEAALERVRARAMAMRSSDELKEVALELRKQMANLGQKELEVCAIHLYEEGENYFESWGALRAPDDQTKLYQGMVKFPKSGIEIVDEMMAHYHAGDKNYVLVNEGEKAKEWLGVMKEYSPQGYAMLEKMIGNANLNHLKAYWAVSDFKGGALVMVTHAEPDESSRNLLHRSATVFQLAYRRYLDLQKAEAQAREAQIEAALEKVRSRTMAMQKSQELAEVSLTLFEQVEQLGIKTWSTGFNVWTEDDTSYIDWVVNSASGKFIEPYKVDLTAHPSFLEISRAKKRGDDFFVHETEGETLKEVYRLLFQMAKTQFEDIVKAGFQLPAHQINHYVFGSKVSLMFITFEPCPEAHDIFKRFGKVFEQTYTRFLDLQKAEAQAREAEIQLALERVRARTMAMQKSEELSEAGSVLFQQLHAIGIVAEGSWITLIDPEEDSMTMWVTHHNISKIPKKVFGDDHPNFRAEIDAWKSKQESIKIQMPYDDFVKSSKEIFGIEVVNAPQKPIVYIQHILHGFGFLGASTYEEISEKDLAIYRRFTKVFEQTYTRFLDLKKAEAQAREAQIEAALERVRSRAMAMRKSEELAEAAELLYGQLGELGITSWTCGYVFIDEENNQAKVWMIEPNGQFFWGLWTVPLYEEKVLKERHESWRRKEKMHRSVLKGKDNIAHHQYIVGHSPVTADAAEDFFSRIPVDLVFTSLHFSYGYLMVITEHLLKEEDDNVLLRFAEVFQLTYTRFLDLQKAEAQAREAQIEASLERVRSKTMAMHNSQDVGESVATLFDELFVLGLLGVNDRCGIGIMQPNEIMEAWTAAKTPEGKAELTIGFINMKVHPMMVSAYGGWVEKKEINQYILEGEDKLSYYDAIRNQSDYKIKRDYFSDQIRIVHTDFYFNEGCLYVFSENEFSAEATSVFLRFVGVFGQTYRRYLDLQRAEKQAKEAQIEAALERVRSRSMAMQHSSELNLILSKVFEELTNLELQMERAVIWIYYPENRSVRWWAANPEAESGSESFFIANQDDPVYDEYWKAWEERRTKDLYVLEGDYKENWTEILFNKTELGRLPEVVKEAMVKPERLYLYNTFNDFGVLFISCLEPLSDDKFTILERFGKVFDQSYTRFKDIKQAEAREKEAIKQSSLDRVRAEIASMRTTQDLERITPLIWSELLTLGVPFFRCGLMIVDEKEEKVRFYLSTPDGKPLAALNLHFESNDISSNGVKHWRKQEPYIAHWNQEEFLAFTKTLLDQQQIENPSTYQGGETPPESLTLQFIPFPQGMLYVGSAEDLTPAQIDLVKNLADTFSVAYARYEDFKQLEDAKSQIEHTLSELKSTQSQLIQSEKMASLGELTAGIAHEIQNPLNFVNNFSEVSKELLEEMMEEIANGDMEEVKAIADDIIQNLEKINHHGQRADGIVKGMLQHSRSSSGTKEPTDINALADEYLRLAYHGLRAKDKSFNASLETDFDDAIGNINVVPQDLGRVILNLITNAFYAVNEKKQKDNNFKPIVSVSTKKTGDHLEIKVTDNGGGIPQKVLDKVFQPFFTTKPTGQGTGLGLSMSYDIVTKGHGGVLKVETKEGEGTTFCINLPVNNLP